jgi:chromosome segregation ATPase
MIQQQQRQYPVRPGGEGRSSKLIEEISADQIVIERGDYLSGSGEDTGNINQNNMVGENDPPRGPNSIEGQDNLADQTSSSSQDSLDAFYKSHDSGSDLASTSFLPSPLADAIHDDRHSYEVPLGGDSRTPSPSALTSERARRISAAGLSQRRRSSMRTVSGASSTLPELSHSPGSTALSYTSAELRSPPVQHDENKSPLKHLSTTGQDHGTPLRERNGDSMLSSPGIGRHASPHSTPSHSNHSIEILHQQSQSLSIQPSLSRIYGDEEEIITPKGGNVAMTAAQKRKVDLLAVVRSSSKPRAFRGTPHPHRSKSFSMRKDVLALSEESEGEELDNGGSSSDLTNELNRNGKKTKKFEGANSYLKSLNTHLTTENQSLIASLSSSSREMTRLRRKAKSLEEELSRSGSGSLSADRDHTGEYSTTNTEEQMDRADELNQQLEGLIGSHDTIVQLQNQLGQPQQPTDINQSKMIDLARKVQQLDQLVIAKDEEIVDLRELVVRARDMTINNEDFEELVQELQREVFELKDQLVESRNDAATKEGALDSLRAQFDQAGQQDSNVVATLRNRSEELMADLDERDGELAAASGELEEQEKEFADKMQKLEEELCRVMEEQEDQLEEARAELEANRSMEMGRRAEDAKKLNELRNALDTLEAELIEVKEERNALERRIESDETQDLEEEKEKLTELRQKSEDLERVNAAKDVRLAQLSDRVESIREQHQDEIELMTTRIDELESAINESAKEFEVQQSKLQQSEEVCDELERLNEQSDVELESLRLAVNNEKANVASLSAQLSHLAPHKTKAKSPLGNELFSTSTRDAIVGSLESDLEHARQQISQLQEKLTTNEMKMEGMEIKEMRIKALESSKLELEGRVRSLRAQESFSPSPKRTPDKSMMFKSIIGISTPKTPGQFNNNVSLASLINCCFTDDPLCDSHHHGVLERVETQRLLLS